VPLTSAHQHLENRRHKTHTLPRAAVATTAAAAAAAVAAVVVVVVAPER